MKSFHHFMLSLLMFCGCFLYGQALPLIDLPANWYSGFPVTHWQDTRANVNQTLTNQNMNFTQNAAGEYTWNEMLTNYPIETNLLFTPGELLSRISVYIHENTDAALRHQQWFSLFSAHYGNDYTETNTPEIHKFAWPNENGTMVELIWFKNNPNFSIRAEFLRP